MRSDVAAVRGVGGLSAAEVARVLRAGTAAPSNLNTQPWLFGCTPSEIVLFADPSPRTAGGRPG